MKRQVKLRTAISLSPTRQSRAVWAHCVELFASPSSATLCNFCTPSITIEATLTTLFFFCSKLKFLLAKENAFETNIICSLFHHHYTTFFSTASTTLLQYLHPSHLHSRSNYYCLFSLLFSTLYCISQPTNFTVFFRF